MKLGDLVRRVATGSLKATAKPYVPQTTSCGKSLGSLVKSIPAQRTNQSAPTNQDGPDPTKEELAYTRKKAKQRAKYALTKAAGAFIQDDSRDPVDSFDQKAAKLLEAARLAGPVAKSALKPLVPQFTHELAATLQEARSPLETRIKLLASLLPARSRFRKTIVKELAEGETDNWVSTVFGLGSEYRRNAARRQKAGTPLYDEKIAGPASLVRESVSQLEISLFCKDAKDRMIVKSGTRRETFKIEVQKQHLLTALTSSYPRRLRSQFDQDSKIRACPGAKLTIFQRNLEYALWLRRQPGLSSSALSSSLSVTYTRALGPTPRHVCRFRGGRHIRREGAAEAPIKDSAAFRGPTTRPASSCYARRF